MKSHIILIASVLLALTSCGTTASFTQATGQQKYQDGIYYRPQSLSLALEEQAAKLSETDELIAKTKSSAVFVKTVGKVDTLFVPENMTAQFKFNHKDSTTTVSLFDDSDLWYGWGFGISPYRFGRWYDPFWGPSWTYSSLYWGIWDPFWYDPFWYDPFWGPSWMYGMGPHYFWGDPFWSIYYPYGGWYGPFVPGYFSYYAYSNRYIHGKWDNWGGSGIATRSNEGRITPNPRTGVGRVIRTTTPSAGAAGNSVIKNAAASRVSSVTRVPNEAPRSASAAVRRQSGVSSSQASAAARPAVRASTPNISRAGSSSTGSAGNSSAYRRSVPSVGSSGGASRASGSISRGSV